MATNYKITEIKGTYDSNYPDSKKYVFRARGAGETEDYKDDLSAFSKFPMAVGQEITGHIEIKGQYHNFKWGKKVATYTAGGTSGDLNRVELKTDRVLANLATIGADITSIKGVLSEILSKLPREDGPPF